MKKIYLAIPYTGMEESAYKQATEITALLLKLGNLNVFSPITHSHPLHADYGVEGTWDFWSKIDYQFIDWCDEVWVVHPREGLSKVFSSTGVTAEVKYAEENNKPVKVLHIETVIEMLRIKEQIEQDE